MTQNEREQIQRVIGMLTALEQTGAKSDGAMEVILMANGILKELVFKDWIWGDDK